jgi:transposase, IS4 family
MEFQLADRISFQHFIDSAEIPDFSTIWRFRERLNKSGVWKAVWNELQNQLDNKNLKIKRGHIQDADESLIRRMPKSKILSTSEHLFRKM